MSTDVSAKADASASAFAAVAVTDIQLSQHHPGIQGHESCRQ